MNVEMEDEADNGDIDNDDDEEEKEENIKPMTSLGSYKRQKVSQKEDKIRKASEVSQGANSLEEDLKIIKGKKKKSKPLPDRNRYEDEQRQIMEGYQTMQNFVKK
jgi:hypothetical protein